MRVRILLRFGGIEFDDVVNAQNLDGGLGGEFEALNLAERRLDDATREVVGHTALTQIESVVSQVLWPIGNQGVFRCSNVL
jgi:hypothetical protein